MKMKSRVIIVMAFISLSSRADFLGLGRAFSSIFSSNSNSQVTNDSPTFASTLNYCHQENLPPDLELNAQCVRELCRESADSSIYLTNSSVSQRLSEANNALESFSALAPALVDTLTALEVNQRALMQYANQKKEEMYASIDNMRPIELQDLANKLLEEYVINYRWDKSGESPFMIIPDFLNSRDQDALRSYAQMAWSNRDNYPTDVNPSMSLKEQREAAHNSLDRALKIARDNPSDNTGELSFVESYIGVQKQKVALAFGHDLEAIIIESERKLRTFYSIEVNIDVVNHDNLNFCRNDSCINLIKSLAEKRIEEKIRKNTELPSEALVNQALVACQSHYLSTYLDQASFQNARDSFSEVLEVFISRGMRNFSQHTKTLFRNYSNQINVEARSITRATPESARNYLATQSPPNEYRPSNFFGNNGNLLRTLLGVNDRKTYLEFDINSICMGNRINSDFMVNVGSSQYETSRSINGHNGRILVGQGTSHHFLQGKQIIAKELGHILTESFFDDDWSAESRETYTVARRCATQSYLTGSAGYLIQGVRFDYDLITTDEDFADMMAFRTYSDEEELFTCGLFQDVMNNPNANEFMILDPNQTRRQSTPFFRLLQEVINKRRPLGSSCQRVLNSNRNHISTTPCF